MEKRWGLCFSFGVGGLGASETAPNAQACSLASELIVLCRCFTDMIISNWNSSNIFFGLKEFIILNHGICLPNFPLLTIADGASDTLQAGHRI